MAISYNKAIRLCHPHVHPCNEDAYTERPFLFCTSLVPVTPTQPNHKQHWRREWSVG